MLYDMLNSRRHGGVSLDVSGFCQAKLGVWGDADLWTAVDGEGWCSREADG